jgi:nicotinamide-nucleotide amidase
MSNRVLLGELLATGDELVTGAIADTNGALAANRLREVGVSIQRMTVVGDGQATITAEVAAAATRAEVLVVCGGLGPTEDDRTAAAIAAAAGVELEQRAEALAHVRLMFDRYGVPMTKNNEKQAVLPKGAEILDNPVGTAVGFCVKIGRCQIFSLPGVPHEYAKMLEEQVLPRVAKAGGVQQVTRVLRVYGYGESKLETELSGIAWPASVELGYRAVIPEIHLRLYTTGDAESVQRLDSAEASIRARIGSKLYATGETTLAQTLGALLTQRSWHMAVAESCTAGMLGQILTEGSGASEFFERGFITYSNRAKTEQLGVSTQTIGSEGAVSEATALEMARGTREKAGVQLALSITGIAGPGGGSADKPVGTVWIGLATPSGVSARRHLFRGSRDRIRRSATWAAMDEARRWLMDNPGS